MYAVVVHIVLFIREELTTTNLSNRKVWVFFPLYHCSVNRARNKAIHEGVGGGCFSAFLCFFFF